MEVERPQTPVRPFPYDEQEVSFENTTAGITLAGTLTLPREDKNLPAVLLIAGSGRNDRDETSMGHFLLLSDFLTRNGYDVLRYDKRGVGASGDDYGLAFTGEKDIQCPPEENLAAIELREYYTEVTPTFTSTGSYNCSKESSNYLFD